MNRTFGGSLPLTAGAAAGAGAACPAAAASVPSEIIDSGDHSIAADAETTDCNRGEAADVKAEEDEESEEPEKMFENMERASCGVGMMGWYASFSSSSSLSESE